MITKIISEAAATRLLLPQNCPVGLIWLFGWIELLPEIGPWKSKRIASCCRQSAVITISAGDSEPDSARRRMEPGIPFDCNSTSANPLKAARFMPLYDSWLSRRPLSTPMTLPFPVRVKVIWSSAVGTVRPSASNTLTMICATSSLPVRIRDLSGCRPRIPCRLSSGLCRGGCERQLVALPGLVVPAWGGIEDNRDFGC